MSNVATIQQHKQSPFAVMASRLNIDEGDVQALMTNTLMKAKGDRGQVSNEELVTFLSIANEYRLNPLTKEIYAFNNRGAIQPIVSIDGWLKIINGHPQFDGMEFSDSVSDGHLQAVTCRIYRKDRQRPTEVTEYMNECAGTSEPWKKWPARMLRHKATIQAARYAFGLSGIIDEDEAERYRQTDLRTEREINPQTTSLAAKLAPVSATPVAELLQHLPHCVDKQDRDDWKAAANVWPADSREYAELIAAYQSHVEKLKQQAQPEGE